MGYCTQLLYPIIMTEQQIAVIVVQMHAVAFAIAEHFTVGTLPFACPFTVAVRFEFVVPDVDEFIFVDIPLVEIGTNARTTGNGTVCQHRSRTDSGIALENGVAHFGFVVSEEPFATVAGVYLSFLPAVADEVKALISL